MGQSLDQILAQAANNDTVGATIVSNQDNGIASYAVGSLRVTKGNLEKRLPTFLVSDPNGPFQMYFSDRTAGGQPFIANETENLGVSIQIGLTGGHVMELEVFGTKSPVTLSPMGDLLVGLGPSLGDSAAGVFVVAFTGLARAPH
jgi:hypothetical protein